MPVVGNVQIPISVGAGFAQQLAAINSGLQALQGTGTATATRVAQIGLAFSRLPPPQKLAVLGGGLQALQGSGLAASGAIAAITRSTSLLASSAMQAGRALLAINPQVYLASAAAGFNLVKSASIGTIQFLGQVALRLANINTAGSKVALLANVLGSASFVGIAGLGIPFATVTTALTMLIPQLGAIGPLLGQAWLAPAVQATAQTVILSQVLGTVVAAAQRVGNSFLRAGLNGKAAFLGIAGIARLLPSLIGLIDLPLNALNQIFLQQLIPNLLVLNKLFLTYQGFTKAGLYSPVRYQDWVILAAIVKELVPKTSLLSQTLNTIVTPIKLVRTTQGLLMLFTQLQGAVSALQMEINQLSLGALRSAGSILQGGGFLMPGQIAPGPTVMDMFQKQQGIEQFVQFELLTKQFNAVSQVGGATSGAIAAVNREILQLAVRSGQTVEVLAPLASQLKGAGFSAAEIKNQMQPLAYAATATGESVQQVTTGVIDSLTAFGMGAEKTATVSDILTAVSLQTGQTIAQLGAAMKNASTVATDSNQSFNDVVLTIGLLSQAGIESSQAGNALTQFLTGLKTAIADIQSGRDTTKTNALQMLGLSTEDLVDAQGNIRSLSELIPALKQGFDSLAADQGSAAAGGVIAKLFGVQGAETVTALIRSSASDINALSATINQAGGISEKVASSQMQTLTGTLQRLSLAAQGISITVGQFFAPLVNAAISWIADMVEGFLKLPPPLQVFALTLSVIAPLLLTYFQGIKTLIYVKKTLAIAQTLYNVALDLSSGKLTLVQVQTAVLAEIEKGRLLIVKGTAFATDVLTGKITLQAAQQKILNLANTLGAANAKEYLNTTLEAGKVFLRHIATLGLLAGAFWAGSEAWKSFNAGQETVDKINQNTDAIVKFQNELNKTPTTFDKASDAWSKFISNLNNKGPIEAVQTALADLGKATGLANSDSSSDYGNQGTTITNTQFGNQRAMEALDRQLNVVNERLGVGQKLLQNYGIESLDAGDRTRLGADGIAKFKAEAGDQIKVLDKTIETLQGQKAPTEAQQALINSAIANAERQKNIIRQRIDALDRDSAATGKNAQANAQAKFTLESLTSEYEKNLAALNLKSQVAKTAAAQALASGKDERDVNAKSLLDEKAAIEEKIRLNSELGNKLKVAAVGATGEDADKIAEQERKVAFEAEQLKTELAENSYRQRQERNRKAIADEQLTSAKAAAAIQNTERGKIAAIRQLQLGGLSGDEAEKRIAVAKEQTNASEIAAEGAKLERLRGLRAQGAIDAEKFATDELNIINRIEELKLQKVEQAVQAQEAARQRQIKAIESAATIQKAASDSAVTAIERQTQSVRSLVQEQERAKQVIEAESGLNKAIADSQQGKTQGKIDLLSKATEARKRIDTEQDLPPEVKAVLEQQLNKVGLGGTSEVGLIEKRQALENQLASQRTDALKQEQAVQKELLESEQQRAKFSAQIALSEARIADIKARAAEIEAKANLTKANLSGDKAAIASARAQLEAAQAGREASKDGIQIAQQNISLQSKLANTNRRKLQIEQQAARERMAEGNQLKGFDQAVELAEAKARAKKPQAKKSEQPEFSDLKIPTDQQLTEQFNEANKLTQKPTKKTKKDSEKFSDLKIGKQVETRSETDAFEKLDAYFKEAEAGEKKAVEARLAAREKLKKETLEKIEAVRKAEEFAIEQGAKEGILKAKQKQLKAGGGEEAKATADKEMTAIAERQTQQELALIQKKIADNDKLEKLGFRSAQEAADARQNLQRQLVDKEIQAVDQRLAAQERLKQGILDRIEATRKAEEFAIDRQANLDILAAKKQLLASGGGEKAKQRSEDTIAGINQNKTLSEIDAIRNRLADNDKLEKQGTRSPKEAAEVRRGLQNDLIQKEINLTEQQISAQERLRQKQAQAIEEAIAKSKLKSDAIVANFEREKQAAESINKALDQNKQLIESRAGLSKARADVGQTRTQSDIESVDRAIQARQKLNSDENLTPQTRQALEQNLRGANLDLSEADLIELKLRLENELAAQKRQSLEQEQAIAQQLLEIDLNRNQLAAQLAVTEARILEAKSRQAQFEAQSNLEKARATGDEQQIASAQAGIEAAVATRDAAAQAMALASAGVQIQAEVAANSRATLAAQQEAARTQLEASENARRWASNLQAAEAATKGISSETNKAKSSSSGTSSASSGATKGGRVMVYGSQEHVMSEEADKAYSKAIAENKDAQSQQKALLALALNGQKNNPYFFDRLQTFGMGNIANLAGSLSRVNPLEVAKVQQDATISGESAIAALERLAEGIDKLANRPSVGTLNVSSPNPTQDAFGIMRDVTVNAGR